MSWKDPDKEQPREYERVIVTANPLYSEETIEVAEFYGDEFYINGRTARVSHWDKLPDNEGRK